jgi:hypothetical protein
MRSVALALTLLLGAGTAAAAKKAKRPPKPEPVAQAKQGAVEEMMAPYKWGMTLADVMGALDKTITAKHAEELEKLTDVYRRTQILKDIKAEVATVKRSYQAFDGQKTGWDVSIIEGEFAHKNDEAMAIYHEIEPEAKKDQRRFFFFYEGKLWKMFVAFDMSPFKDKTFADFRQVMEARYGKGTPIMKNGPDGKPKLVAVEWRSGGTTLRAVDLLKFYGNFCLVLSDDTIEKVVADRRATRSPKPPPRVTGPDENPSNLKVNDPNADVVDRITKGEGSSPDQPTTPEKK